jgi:DNA-binding MarR family transcriptional regulator
VPYINAFVDALAPIFAVAAALSLVAFGLTWLLREIPLRQTAQSEGVGEAFASPRDDDSYRELERALTVLARREEHWGIYERLAERSGVRLEPRELWLFARIAEREPRTRKQLDADLPVERRQLDASLALLEERGLVATDGRVELTPLGQASQERLVAARRVRLGELLGGWNPEEHADLRRLLDELARAVTSAMPAPPRAD